MKPSTIIVALMLALLCGAGGRANADGGRSAQSNRGWTVLATPGFQGLNQGDVVHDVGRVKLVRGRFTDIYEGTLITWTSQRPDGRFDLRVTAISENGKNVSTYTIVKGWNSIGESALVRSKRVIGAAFEDYWRVFFNGLNGRQDGLWTASALTATGPWILDPQPVATDDLARARTPSAAQFGDSVVQAWESLGDVAVHVGLDDDTRNKLVARATCCASGVHVVGPTFNRGPGLVKPAVAWCGEHGHPGLRGLWFARINADGSAEPKRLAWSEMDDCPGVGRVALVSSGPGTWIAGSPAVANCEQHRPALPCGKLVLQSLGGDAEPIVIDSTGGFPNSPGGYGNVTLGTDRAFRVYAGWSTYSAEFGPVISVVYYDRDAPKRARIQEIRRLVIPRAYLYVVSIHVTVTHDCGALDVVARLGKASGEIALVHQRLDLTLPHLSVEPC